MRNYALVAVLSLSACSSDGGNADTSAADATSSGETDSGDASDSVGDSAGETHDIPECTPGAFGCVCAPGDTCSPDLDCVDGMCTFGDCTTGVLGCPCGEGGACVDGLFCYEETCVDCMPGTGACECLDGACDEGLMCIDDGCWLPSPYPLCGWLSQGWYFCAPAPTVAHPDWPIECPLDLVVGMPCPPELTYEGCCDETGTWWCQNGGIQFMACE